MSSSFFYLGIIYIEGIYVDQHVDKAVGYYIKGAAKNNAYCYFELSRIYSEGIPDSLDYERDNSL